MHQIKTIQAASQTLALAGDEQVGVGEQGAGSREASEPAPASNTSSISFSFSRYRSSYSARIWLRFCACSIGRVRATGCSSACSWMHGACARPQRRQGAHAHLTRTAAGYIEMKPQPRLRGLSEWCSRKRKEQHRSTIHCISEEKGAASWYNTLFAYPTDVPTTDMLYAR